MCTRLVAIIMVLGTLSSAPVDQARGAVRRPSQVRTIRWIPQYTLRLRIVGYDDLIVAADEESADEILTELTVPITIGLPFKRSLRNGKSSFSVSGLVTVTKKHQFAIDIKCAESLELDDLVFDEHGRLTPEISETKAHSLVGIKIGVERDVGGGSAANAKRLPDGSIQHRMTKKSFRVRLDVYKPKAGR
ncbi:MAG: hypothetical protein HON53_22310 [Planctomycetaceae bacterium]|jgi:hypothetical protein|nr:hypothetical protein [Planctomycetaceae bacterium]MBT6483647.1 hypothetical protein [Planctomycetaceae bacterium]MBT6495558.1 hypothetical protein [Planctomycetaceae bacterium]